MVNRMAYVVVNIMKTLVLGYQFFLFNFCLEVVFLFFPLSEEMWSEELLVLAVIMSFILFIHFHLQVIL